MLRVAARAGLTVLLCLALLAGAMHLASLARLAFAEGGAGPGAVYASLSVVALAAIVRVVTFVRKRSAAVADQPAGQPSNWRWGQGGT